MKKTSTVLCKCNSFCKCSFKRILSGCMLVIIVLMSAGCKSGDYKKANNLFVMEEYSSAKVVFDTLGDYKNSEEMSAECLYQIAIQYYNDNDYKNAIAILVEINDYDKATQAIHAIALKLIYDEYVEQLTKTIQSYSTYLNSESKKVLAWVYGGMENDYDIDYNSIEFKNFANEKSSLNDISDRINDVFTAEILEKCDDLVKNAYEKFSEVDAYINNTYTVANVFTLITNGGTNDIFSLDESTTLVSELEKALKDLKSE